MAVSIVDEYISNCDEVIADAEMMLALKIGHTDVPFPSGPRFPNDLDWFFLDDEILYEMLTLANKTATAERAIDYIAQEVAHPPEYAAAFKAREDCCEELKTIASDLAQQLRDTWGLLQRLDLTEAG